MKTFTYTITDPEGIHARPAGELVKAAAACACDVKIAANGKEVDAKRIFGVMSLGAKQGAEITLTCDGEGEDEAMETLSTFLKENM